MHEKTSENLLFKLPESRFQHSAIGSTWRIMLKSRGGFPGEGRRVTEHMRYGRRSTEFT